VNEWITAVSYWTQDFDTQRAIFRTLFPYPQNKVLVFESSLCSSPNIPIKPPPFNNVRFPQKPIVIVKQLGPLGKQMWEYISVWAVAKKTEREPYVPSCLIRELEKIFRNLPVPPLSYLAYCPLQEQEWWSQVLWTWASWWWCYGDDNQLSSTGPCHHGSM